MTILIILGVIVLLTIAIVGFFITSYNKLVSSKEMVSNARGQIAAQIESRFDALASLIEATKQYTSHEAETLESVVNQRSALTNSMTNDDFEKAEEIHQSSLSRLIAISEAYPELKASGVYKQSMSSIDKYEKNVRLSRMAYNDSVTKYNKLIMMIPTNIIASLTNHQAEVYFEAKEEKSEIPSWN